MTEFFGDDSYGTNVPAWMMYCLPMHNLFTIEQANTYLMWELSVSATSATLRLGALQQVYQSRRSARERDVQRPGHFGFDVSSHE